MREVFEAIAIFFCSKSESLCSRLHTTNNAGRILIFRDTGPEKGGGEGTIEGVRGGDTSPEKGGGEGWIEGVRGEGYEP